MVTGFQDASKHYARAAQTLAGQAPGYLSAAFSASGGNTSAQTGAALDQAREAAWKENLNRYDYATALRQKDGEADAGAGRLIAQGTDPKLVAQEEEKKKDGVLRLILEQQIRENIRRFENFVKDMNEQKRHIANEMEALQRQIEKNRERIDANTRIAERGNKILDDYGASGDMNRGEAGALLKDAGAAMPADATDRDIAGLVKGVVSEKSDAAATLEKKNAVLHEQIEARQHNYDVYADAEDKADQINKDNDGKGLNLEEEKDLKKGLESGLVKVKDLHELGIDPSQAARMDGISDQYQKEVAGTEVAQKNEDDFGVSKQAPDQSAQPAAVPASGPRI